MCIRDRVYPELKFRRALAAWRDEHGTGFRVSDTFGSLETSDTLAVSPKLGFIMHHAVLFMSAILKMEKSIEELGSPKLDRSDRI